MPNVCPPCCIVLLRGWPALVILLSFVAIEGRAVPLILNYQGRILSGTTHFDGVGQFKFAIVSADGATAYWLNSPDANADQTPDSAVSVTVTRGLYSVHIGDTALQNMAALPPSAFSNDALYLRVWFSDGVNPFERLTPDQQLTSVAFAVRSESAATADSVPAAAVAGTLNAAQIPALDAAKITTGTFVSSRIPSLDSSKIISGIFNSNRIPVLDASKIGAGVLDPSRIPTLDAASIATGIFDSARLPANVAYRDTDLVVSSNALSDRIVTINGSLTSQITALTAQLTQLQTQLQSVSNLAAQIPSSLTAASTDSSDAALLGQGFVSFMNFSESPWQNGNSTGAIAGRTGHSAVWSGTELLIWGGLIGDNSYSAAGAGYSPSLDQWTPITAFSAPSARSGHGAVWTGSTMIVWGGEDAASFLNSGGMYDPLSLQWTATATASAPSARADFACTWTGDHMLVWGGNNTTGFLANGGLYNPSNNTWSALPTTQAPAARRSPGAAWTGSQYVIWGGDGQTGAIATGARIAVAPGGIAGAWQPISPNGAPSARSGHSVTSTGAKVIVWGGRAAGTYFNDGAIYNPATDSWSVLPSQNAPTPREKHVAVWTGSELLVFGGEDSNGALATGGAFDPSANKWRPLNGLGNPIARSEAEAVWTGSELAIFGGRANGQLIASLQRLNPQPSWHLYRKL